MSGRPRAQDAVSSVIGTVLILGITVSVFAGVSIVVLSEFDEADATPRSELGVLAGTDAYLLQHRGGDPIPLDSATLTVGVGGIRRTVPLTEFAGDTADGATWRLGESLCVSCLYPGQEVEGVQLVAANTLLLNEGVVPGADYYDGVELVVALRSTTPATPSAGQTVTFSVRVLDLGTAPTPSGVDVVVELRVDDVAVDSVTTQDIPSGGAANLDLAWTATAGSHTVVLEVDPGDLVAEADETNNQATDTLVVSASVADPGFAFEDTNGDLAYTVGTDIALDGGELDDGVHDAGANALVLPPSIGPLSAPSFDLAGTGLVVHRGLTAEDGGVTLTSAGDLALDGDLVLLVGTHPISITAAGDLDLEGRITARGAVTIQGASVAMDAIQLEGSVVGGDLSVTATAGDVLLDGASLRTYGAQTLTASGSVLAPDASFDLRRDGDAFTVTAGATIDLSGMTLDSLGAVTVDGAGDVGLSDAVVQMGGDLDVLFIDGEGALDAVGTDIELRGAATLEGGTVDATDLRLVSTFNNDNFVVTSTVGALTAVGATIDGDGHITLTSATSLDASGASVTTPTTNSRDVTLYAQAGHLDVRTSTLVAERSILLKVENTSWSVLVQDASFTDRTNAAKVSPSTSVVVGTPASGGVE